MEAENCQKQTQNITLTNLNYSTQLRVSKKQHSLPKTLHLKNEQQKLMLREKSKPTRSSANKTFIYSSQLYFYNKT